VNNGVQKTVFSNFTSWLLAPRAGSKRKNSLFQSDEQGAAIRKEITQVSGSENLHPEGNTRFRGK
jgi:hypothetical protein